MEIIMADPILDAVHSLVDLGIFLRKAAANGISSSDVSSLLRDHALEDELATTLDSLKAVEAEGANITHSPMSAFGLVGPVVSELSRLLAPVK
jgi:hypothetical protein